MSCRVRKISKEEFRIKRLIKETIGKYIPIFEARQDAIRKHVYPKYNDDEYDIKYELLNKKTFDVDIMPIKMNTPFISGKYEVFRTFKYPQLTENYEKYPNSCNTKMVINQLAQELKLDKDWFKPHYGPRNKEVARVLTIELFAGNAINELIRILDTALHITGYFRIIEPRDEYDYITGVHMITIQYEPYHYTLKERNLLGSALYHVTLIENKESILKNGLIPHEKDELYLKYPPRNYLFKKYNYKLVSDYMNDSGKLKKPRNHNDVIVFVANVKDIDKDVRFYVDPMFAEHKSEDAVYTYETINVSAIRKHPYEIVI